MSPEVAPTDDATQSYIDQILADAPPLDDEQAALIVAMLRDALMTWAARQSGK